MKKNIYIEEEIKNHPRTKKILKKFVGGNIIYINKYTEIFNKRNQNFNIQKINPAIILAKKKKNFVAKTPESYGIGTHHNYYFSYMYNCLFDCKYCFLQGLYSSANYVIFINYEDFFNDIKNLSKKTLDKRITFFSGYDCDSLAYESFTGFIENALEAFKEIKNADLEIRTKSTFIKPFMKNNLDNVIVAQSFTPESFSRIYEVGVPNIRKRIKALKKVADLGWKVGFRFDPIAVYEGWQKDYIRLFETLFSSISNKQIHSVSFGSLRFPQNIFKRIEKNNKMEKLFFNMIKRNNMYESNSHSIIKKFCIENLNNFINKERIFTHN